MAVYEKNGSWYMKGKVKNENGSCKNYNRLIKDKTVNGKKKASRYEQSWLDKYNEDLEQIQSGAITLEELIKMYLNEKQGQKKSTTLATDKYMFDLMVPLYDKKINLIRSSTIKAYIDSYNTDDHKLSYVNKVRTYLNKLFSYAIKKKMIIYNPVSEIPMITRPDELKEEMKFFTPDEWVKFEEMYPKDDMVFYTIYSLLYYMGMRRGEVLALTRADINLQTGTIRVNKTVSQYVNGTRYIITPPKNGNSYRTIKIPSKLMGTLQAYLEWYSECIGVTDKTFLFGIDLPIITKTVDKRFKRNCDKAGIKKIRIHDLRHSHATLLINNGANVKAISDRLGNTVEEVLKTYAHLFSETEDAMIDIVNSVFDVKKETASN